MDSITQARLVGLHPLLVQRYAQLDKLVGVSGVNMRITAGYRTPMQQDALYKQGRVTPGPIVTNAESYQSWHVYGFAVDVVPMVNGEPDWNLEGENWPKIFTATPQCGLFSGKNFKSLADNPHIQLAEIPESPTAQDIQDLTQSGMDAVWSRYFPQAIPATDTSITAE